LAPQNILFIVADDLNSWIEPLGRHPDVRTPSINRLAQRGTLFSRAYCSAPYCNASRMAAFTACHPSTTGVFQNEPFWEAPLRKATALEHLANAGYYRFGAGKVFHGTYDYARAGRDRLRAAKWRDTENREAAWDQFHRSVDEPLPLDRPLNGMFDFDNFDAVHPRNHHFDWGELPDELEEDMPDARTVRAVSDFLRDPPSGPFICAAGFYKPHLPWYVPKRFLDLYPLEHLSLPFVKKDDLNDVPAIARKWAVEPNDHKAVLAHDQWRQAVQGYLAAISYCDEQIGKVIAALDDSPAADNTIIVLWGDNGFHLGEKLHWRKFVLWEEATRVPFIVAPAGSRTGRVVEEPVSLVDMWPTLLDLAGLPPMEGVDGRSLAMTMAGSRSPGRALMTWQKGNNSLRSGDLRYTRYRDGAEELYDHSVDPFEWTNRINDERYRERADAMRFELVQTLSQAD
jgi:arylsulfatase A-like enzyme